MSEVRSSDAGATLDTYHKALKYCAIMELPILIHIALDYGLDDRGSRVRFPAAVGNFPIRHRVQNGSGAYPASYPRGTRGYFPWGRAAGA
jgi:hypothetical protein